MGLITDHTLEEWLTEKDEIYALNGTTLSELGCKSHQDFAREVVSISEQPLYVSFISEDSLSQARVEAAAAADEGILAAVGQAMGFGGGYDDEEEVVAAGSAAAAASERAQGPPHSLGPVSSVDHASSPAGPCAARRRGSLARASSSGLRVRGPARNLASRERMAMPRRAFARACAGFHADFRCGLPMRAGYSLYARSFPGASVGFCMQVVHASKHGAGQRV